MCDCEHVFSRHSKDIPGTVVSTSSACSVSDCTCKLFRIKKVPDENIIKETEATDSMTAGELNPHHLSAFRKSRGKQREPESTEKSKAETWDILENARDDIKKIKRMAYRGAEEDVIEKAKEILRKKPDDIDAFCDMASALRRRGKLEEAKATCKHALIFNEKNTRVLRLLGGILNDLGDTKQSIECYKKIFEEDDDLFALDMLGYLHTEIEQNNEAIKYFDIAIERDEKTKFGYINKANALYELEKFDEALKIAKIAIDVEPNGETPHNLMGLILAKQEQFERAIESFERAIEITHENWMAPLRSKGNALYDLRRYDEALLCFTKVFANPTHQDDSTLLFKIAYCFAAAEKYEISLVYYQRARIVGGETEAQFNNIAQIFGKLGRSDEESDYYKKALKLDPDYTIPLRNLLQIHWDNNEYEEMFYYAEKLVSLDSKTSADLQKLGTANYHLKKYEDAIECFDEVLEKETDGEYNVSSTLNMKGLSLGKLKKYEDAIKCFEKGIKFLELNGEDYQKEELYKIMIQNIGFQYQEMEDYETAIKYHSRSSVIDPNYDEPLIEMGFCYNCLDRFDDAIEVLDSALQIDNTDDRIFRRKASAYYGLKKSKEYVDCVRKVVELVPDDAYSWKKLADISYDDEKWSEAILFYQKAIRVGFDNDDENWEDVCFCLGASYFWIKDYKNAEHYLEKNLHAENMLASDSTCMIGRCQRKLKNYTRSIEYYDSALERFEQDRSAKRWREPRIKEARLYVGKGVSLEFNNEISKAIECCDKAIEIEPDYWQAWCNKSILLEKNKDFPEALSCCEKCLQIEPNDVKMYNQIIAICERMDDAAKVKEYRSKRDALKDLK